METREKSESQELNGDSLLTSHEVGQLLQVNPSSVNKWVNEGLIPAFRTPGGHRRIRAYDLVSFLRTHRMPIPRALEDASKRRLLIVDDDAKAAKALERVLKKYQDRLQVMIVSNGIDALVQVGSFKPHLILLDVFMPEIDGIEVCRRLKAAPETQTISVIVMSGQMKPDLADKAMSAGALLCLPKPIEIESLLQPLGLAQAALSAANY